MKTLAIAQNQNVVVIPEIIVNLDIPENKRLKRTLVKTTDFNQVNFDVKKIECEYESISPVRTDIVVYPFGPSRPVRVGCTSDDYFLVPNNEVFGLIRQSIIDKGINFVEKYTMYDYSSFQMELFFPDYYFILNGKDVCFLKFSMLNSYSGVSKHDIHFGVHRQVCTNGLTLPISDYSIDFSGKHTKKLATDLQGFDQRLNNFLNSPKDLQKPFEVLEQRKLNKADLKAYIEPIIKQAGILPVENSKFNTYDYLNERIETEMNVLNVQEPNKWLVYNAINHYLYNDGLNNFTPEKRAKIDRAVMMLVSK